MDFIYFDKGVVKMTEEGLSIPCFKELYDRDKLKGKPSFKRYIEYIWYLYSKESPYENVSFVERLTLVEENIFRSSKCWVHICDDVPLVKECALEYENRIKSREDKQYDKLMEDIDAYIDELKVISVKKRIKIRVDYEDPETGEKVYKDVFTEIHNTEERANARKEIKEAYNLADFLKDRISKHGGPKKRKYLRIFDNPES